MLATGILLPPENTRSIERLWFEKSGCSRTDYVRLREVLQLSKLSTVTDEETNSTAVEEDSKFDALPKKLGS